MSKFHQYAAGFLIGTLAGSLIVLFSTPQSGKELRLRCKKMKNKLKRSSHQLKRDIASFKHNFQQLQIESKKAIKTVGHDIKDSFHNWKEETDPILRKLKSDIDALKAKAEQTAKELNRM